MVQVRLNVVIVQFDSEYSFARLALFGGDLHSIVAEVQEWNNTFIARRGRWRKVLTVCAGFKCLLRRVNGRPDQLTIKLLRCGGKLPAESEVSK